jgi:hypothetical protein
MCQVDDGPTFDDSNLRTISAAAFVIHKKEIDVPQRMKLSDLLPKRCRDSAEEKSGIPLAKTSRMKKSIFTDCAKANVLTVALVFCSGLSNAPTVAAQNPPAAVIRPRIAMAASRKVFVYSTSLLVSSVVVEDKLLKQQEFQQLGFVITREAAEADFVLELRHDLLTKYVFTVIDARSKAVVASGKLSSLGGTVAGKVAKRFVKEMSAMK